MKHNVLKTSLTLLAAVILTACGGNGSDSEGRLGSNPGAQNGAGGNDLTGGNADGSAGNTGDNSGTGGTGDSGNTGGNPDGNTGGNGNTGGGENTCPTLQNVVVTSIAPENNATDVAITSSVQVTFNTDIDADSVDNGSAFISFQTDTSSGTVDATLDVNANAILINPINGLDELTQYTVNLSTALAAACNNEKTLSSEVTSVFTTGSTQDVEQPEVVISTPDLMGLLPVDVSLVIDFTEPLDSSTVNSSAIFLLPVDSAGTPLPNAGKVTGDFSLDGSRVVFVPSEPLNGDSFYELVINTNLQDLSGNPLSIISTNIFRTESLMAIIDDLTGGNGGANPLADLQSALEDLSGTLVGLLPVDSPLPIDNGDAGDGGNGDEGGNEGGNGLPPLEPQTLFELPLTLATQIAGGVQELIELTGLPLPIGFDEFGGFDGLGGLGDFGELLDPSILADLQALFTEFSNDPTSFNLLEAVNRGEYNLVVLELFPLLVDGNLTPEKLTEFSSVLVAVCDPKGSADGTTDACTLSVNIGFGSFSSGVQQAFADALANGDPAALAQSFLTISNLVFDDSGLVSVELLDDSGLPLPEALETPVVSLLNQIGQIEVLGALTNQEDFARLVDVELFSASLATVDAGRLLSITAIPGALFNPDVLLDPNVDLSLLEANGDLINALSDAGLEPLFDGLCSVRLLCAN